LKYNISKIFLVNTTCKEQF